MKKFFLLPTFTLLACLFPFTNVIAEVSKKQPKEISEKKVELKKKYTFIGKLWEKEKLEPEKKDGDKKGKKLKRSYLLKFEVKEVEKHFGTKMEDTSQDLQMTPEIKRKCTDSHRYSPGWSSPPRRSKISKTDDAAGACIS